MWLCLYIYSMWLYLYIYSMWLLCSTYILPSYFVLYSTWLLCLPTVYTAILFYIYSTRLLCLYIFYMATLCYIYSMPALLSLHHLQYSTDLPSVSSPGILLFQHWIPLHPVPEALKSILSTAPKITGSYLLAMSHYTFWIYQDPTSSPAPPSLLVLGDGYLSSSKAQMPVS